MRLFDKGGDMKFFSIILMAYLLISCQKEIITPEHPTINEQQEIDNSEAESGALETQSRDEDKNVASKDEVKKESVKTSLLTMSGTYKITDYEINNPNPVADTKVIGAVVNEIIGLIVSIDGDLSVDIDPVSVNLAEYDLSMIKVAKIKKLRISISNPEEDTKSRLDFIKQFKLDLVKFTVPAQEFNLLNITKEGIRNDGCGVQCIDINLSDLNLMDLITDTKEIILKPKLSIEKAPKKDFRVDVDVEYYLATEKPF